ncbi:MAG: hypothetical protein HY741_29060 [Chloroflexi bacterium]|nr:hypothetical protein [Chloroflexota bacterium]
MAASNKKKSSQAAPKNQVILKDNARINAKGNVIMGDQIIRGNQYNAARDLNIANVSTPREFIEQLEQVQNEIAMLKQSPQLSASQARRIEVVEGDVVEVLGEAQKPKPLPARIHATLGEAKETMNKIGGSVKSAVELGAALGALAELALKIFGG